MSKQGSEQVNLQHLKYMTEVERTGSVTKAAANLFMGQPNLSKAIKEVETEIGITVFRRSAKGVYPTPEGAEFLARAAAVLAEMDKLEAVYKSESPTQRFSFCVPKAGYVPKFAAELAKKLPEADIECITADFPAAAEKLSEGLCSIAAVRCPDSSRDFFAALANEKNLRAEPLYSSEYVIVTSEKSPLVGLSDISPSDLSRLVRISCDDDSFADIPAARKMTLSSVSDCLELLKYLPLSYMLSAPLPKEKSELYGLVSQKYPASGYTDLILYPHGYKPDEYTSEFVTALKRIITNG